MAVDLPLFGKSNKEDADGPGCPGTPVPPRQRVNCVDWLGPRPAAGLGSSTSLEGGDIGVAGHVKHVCAIQGLVLQPLYFIRNRPEHVSATENLSSVPTSDAHI